MRLLGSGSSYLEKRHVVGSNNRTSPVMSIHQTDGRLRTGEFAHFASSFSIGSSCRAQMAPTHRTRIVKSLFSLFLFCKSILRLFYMLWHVLKRAFHTLYWLQKCLRILLHLDFCFFLARVISFSELTTMVLADPDPRSRFVSWRCTHCNRVAWAMR